MKIVSFNYRGLANISKKSLLMWMVEIVIPYVIILQEVMGISESIKNALEALFQG
jgi:exonuclease III